MKAPINDEPVGLLDCLQDDLALVNDRLSHTVYGVSLSAETTPPQQAELTITLQCDHPVTFELKMHCPNPDVAVQALWQACAIGLFVFSFEAYPSPLVNAL